MSEQSSHREESILRKKNSMLYHTDIVSADKNTIILGTHLSIAGGLVKAAEKAIEIEADTFQMFSRNPRGSGYRTPSEDEVARFRALREENGIGPILAHAPYTLNLASGKPEVYSFACDVIRQDIVRMDRIGVEYLVFHPGSHTGIGVKTGIENIINGLNQAISDDTNIIVLLETMSGKGTEIGATFEELKVIRDGLNRPERVGICLDTCHVYAAGYDVVHNLDAVLDEFDHILGLDILKTVHLNDSMMPFSSHKDRHAVIGDGELGLDALLDVMRHPVLRKLPFYLETPLNDAGHKEEIARLKKILSEEKKNGNEQE